MEVNSSGNLEASSNSEDEDIPLIKLSFSMSTSDDFSKIIGGSLSESDIHLNIPNIVSNKPVGAIGDNAFINNRNIISARIPNTVKYIGAGAFLSCENLEKVNMPESLETIGQSAFQATNISKVTFPETLVSIGCVAFGETPIESITIPASTTDIDGAAFAGSNLKEIKVAEGNEKYISENQMILTKDKSTIVCCAPTVTEPIFDSKCTVIGNNSFALSKIFTLNIPNGIKEIGISAFQGCESLSSVVLPKDLTEIKEHSDLQSNSTVIKLVETILNGNGDNDSDIKKAQAGNKISRSIGDKTARGENKNLDAEKITKFTVSGDAKLQLTNSNGEVTGTSEDASKKKNSFYYCGKDSKITCKKTDNNTMELKVNKDNNNEMYIETQNKNEADNISKNDKPTDEGDKIEEDDGKNSETSDQNNLILIMGIMVLLGGLLKNTKDTVKRL